MNLTWTLGKEREHLATKDEVLDHLCHCVEVIKRRIRVIELFGYEFEHAEEVDGTVRITCSSAECGAMEFETDRLIKAYGQGGRNKCAARAVERTRPLGLTGSLRRAGAGNACQRRAGMDRRRWEDWHGHGSHADHRAARQGGQSYCRTGHAFYERDRLFPSRRRRWLAGELTSSIFIEMARRFDGNNEADVVGWFRDHYGIWLTPETGNLLFAILSESEKETIAAGLNEIVMDYLADVVDRDGGAELVLRSGATIPFETGSWVINCTGSLMGGEHPYEPYASASGRILSIQNRSVTIPFPTGGAAAYFLTHLLFLGKLVHLPLYAIDVEEFRRKAPQYVMAAGLGPLQSYNLSLMLEAIPARQFRKVISQNGLDFDRWFPLPRRLRASAGIMLTHKRDREHHRRALNKVAERFGVRCGPMVGAGRA